MFLDVVLGLSESVKYLRITHVFGQSIGFESCRCWRLASLQILTLSKYFYLKAWSASRHFAHVEFGKTLLVFRMLWVLKLGARSNVVRFLCSHLSMVLVVLVEFGELPRSSNKRHRLSDSQVVQKQFSRGFCHFHGVSLQRCARSLQRFDQSAPVLGLLGTSIGRLMVTHYACLRDIALVLPRDWVTLHPETSHLTV